jgi:hypothetical protein
VRGEVGCIDLVGTPHSTLNRPARVEPKAHAELESFSPGTSQAGISADGLQSLVSTEGHEDLQEAQEG